MVAAIGVPGMAERLTPDLWLKHASGAWVQGSSTCAYDASTGQRVDMTHRTYYVEVCEPYASSGGLAFSSSRHTLRIG